MFLSEGRAKCDEMVQAFVECSKTHGLWVVLRCRDQNKAMNACVSQYTTDEKWKSFRNAKIVSLIFIFVYVNDHRVLERVSRRG